MKEMTLEQAQEILEDWINKEFPDRADEWQEAKNSRDFIKCPDVKKAYLKLEDCVKALLAAQDLISRIAQRKKVIKRVKEILKMNGKLTHLQIEILGDMLSLP